MSQWAQIKAVALFAVWLVVCAAPASSKERRLPFPIGTSDQTWQGQAFAICMPPEYPDEAEGYSLIVTLDSGLAGLIHLTKERFIIVAPRRARDAPGHLWGENEVNRVRRLTAHLVKRLRIAANRVHAVGIGDAQGVFWKLALEKKNPFVSATFVESDVLGRPTAKHLARQMGVLCLTWPGEESWGLRGAENSLAGKVRTVELRFDRLGLKSAYYLHWLRVMEGHFTPGHDLSFDYRQDQAVVPSIDEMKIDRRGYFVYFWSQADKDDKHAKRLQNEVLMDHRVRRPGHELRAFRFEREAHAKLFARFGLSKTPAIVVVEPDGKTTRFQGRIKVKALAKALRRANHTPPDPWAEWGWSSGR